MQVINVMLYSRIQAPSELLLGWRLKVVDHLSQRMQEGYAARIGAHNRPLSVLDTQTSYARMHEGIVDKEAVSLGANQVIE